MDLETLGFTKEELQERVINRICEKLLTNTGYDYDGDSEYFYNSSFANKLNEEIKNQINRKINELAEEHIFPNISSFIENLTLEETNKWGEKKGTKLTFTEYLIQRAEAYMTEEVNYEGKTKAESGSYGWSKSQTRLTHLIHQHLQYSIKTAMENALKIANSSISVGIQEAVKISLAETLKKLRVDVKA